MSESTFFQFEIMTPDRVLYTDQVSMVTVPGAEGPLGILKRHMPVVAQLIKGVIHLKDAGGNSHDFEIESGLLSVTDDVVTVFLPA